MAIDLVVPKLGESISEAVIAKWLKKVGEATAADEPVVDLETDKVSVALPAPSAGVLAEQRFEVGATVRVGEVIGRIDPDARPSSGPPPSAVSSVARAAVEPVTLRPPPEPRILPQPGSTMPPPGDPARLLAMVPAAPAPAAAPRPADGRSRAHPSPSERRALREQSATPPAEPPAPARRAPSSIPPPPPADEEVVPMTPLRRRIAERLVAAQHSAAILTTFNEVDMTNVMALRARFQEGFVARHGIKLGFMSFFVKAAVESLRAFPGLNAEIRGSDIVYKRRYHVGVAVGSGKGLVVPVLRDSDRLSFAGIERTIAELAEKARSGKLAIDDLQGGTFSITNGGIYGSMLSTPLLNLPQTGILGMHNIVKRPVAVGAEVQIRPMMYLALSYDHRVVDGREAVQFLVGVKERIESPEKLLLEI